AGISLATGDSHAASIIAAMVALSVTLGFVQERRSTAAAERLRAMVHTRASVVRRGPFHGTAATSELPGIAHDVPPGSRLAEIPIEQLVPGDVVHLCAGDMVPADLRVITAKDLFVNQAALTGE